MCIETLIRTKNTRNCEYMRYVIDYKLPPTIISFCFYEQVLFVSKNVFNETNLHDNKCQLEYA